MHYIQRSAKIDRYDVLRLIFVLIPLLGLFISIRHDKPAVGFVLVGIGFAIMLLGQRAIGSALRARPLPSGGRRDSKHFGFDEATRAQNKAGKLTRQQFLRVSSHALIWFSLGVSMGSLIMWGGWRVAEQYDRIGVFIIACLIGGASALLGLQKLYAFLRDLAAGVQHATGTLSARGYGEDLYGTWRGSTHGRWHRLQVRMLDSHDIVHLPVDDEFYHQVETQAENRVYTVHYLDRMNQLLSIEAESNAPSIESEPREERR